MVDISVPGTLSPLSYDR